MIESLLAFGAIFLLALLRVPLAWVLLGVGGVGCVWAYVCLGRLAAQAPKKEAP